MQSLYYISEFAYFFFIHEMWDAQENEKYTAGEKL